MKIQNISPCKKYINLPKKKSSKKETQNLSRYHNSIITKSQVSTQAKISSFKNPHIKNRPIIIIIIIILIYY